MRFRTGRLVWIILLLLLMLLVAGCGTDVPIEDDHEHTTEEEDHEHPEPPPDSDEAPVAGGEGVPDIGEVSVPSEGFDHIPQGQQAEYAHFPPSSGEHWAAVAEWGVYDIPIPPEIWVHNLEHSGIAILYNCPAGCPDLVADLETWAESAPDSKWGHPKVLVFPNDQIETPLVALAWGYQLDMDRFDAGMLNVFYTRHLDNGPEDVP